MIDQQLLEQPLINTISLSKPRLKDWITRTENFAKQGIQQAKILV
jgi:hypothetical protein